MKVPFCFCFLAVLYFFSVSLKNEKDFDRLKEIIETGKFWCSKFSELNDPMEGVFKADKFKIEHLYENKIKYKICSFSGKKDSFDPLMWGYYANGFKGVAIEVEVKDEDKKITENEPLIIRNNDDIYEAIHKISYQDLSEETNDIKEILSRKKENWKHEEEYRFLIKEGDSNIEKKSL